MIRYFKTGKKNQPFFKIVVTEKTNPPHAGRFVDEVGFFNPLTKEKRVIADKVKHWLSVGAKPSDTVYNLLVSEKLIEGKKIPVHKKSKKEKAKKETKAPQTGEPEKKEEKPANVQEEKKEAQNPEAPKEEPQKEKKEDQPAQKEETGDKQ